MTTDEVLHGLKEISAALCMTERRVKAWAARGLLPVAYTDDGNGRRYFALRSRLVEFLGRTGKLPATPAEN